MDAWEYKWVFVNVDSGKFTLSKMDLSSDEGIDNLHSSLEKLGSSGWELVSVVPFDGGTNSYGSGPGTDQTMWVFKRRKQVKSE